MQDLKLKYIPAGTSVSGLCLTPANWQELEIDTISYHLDSLFIKPGYALLKEIPDLATYMGWSGRFILNATKLLANKECVITLTSPYDGSKLKLTCLEVMEIIQQLKPYAVLLPENVLMNFPQIWDHWNDEIIPYIASKDLLKQDISRVHGVYFNEKDTQSADFIAQTNKWSNLPRYFLMGSLNFDLLAQIKIEAQECFVESDEPAVLATKGRVFSHNGIIDLTDNQAEMRFETIDSECLCPTCEQSFTQSYLHHLYLHTPLLCQRFLIQHNAYHALKKLK